MKILIKIYLPFIILLTFVLKLSSQEEWIAFTSSKSIWNIEIKGNTLWACTDGGVLEVNLENMSYKKYTIT